MTARFSAILCALAAAFAAPYLIPINSESFVMRGGVFCAILFLSCFSLFPEISSFNSKGFKRAAVLGFCFALALSTGTELYSYGSFLPGTGSAIRRLLVPIMATPFMTALILRFSKITLPGKQSDPSKLEAPLYFAFLFFCWLPVLLAYWPGMLNYDFQAEYSQHLTGEYSLIHPLSHSALMNGLITLGEHLRSRSFGILFISLLQMALLAFALSQSCLLIRKHHTSRAVTFVLLIFFGFHPVFSVMVVSMTKDTIFASCLIGICINTIILLENPEDYFVRKSNIIQFILYSAGTALMRNNGLLALIPLLIALIIKCKRIYRKRTLVLSASGLFTALCIHGILLILLHPVSMPSFQFYSLPAQQLVRAYNADKLTSSEREQLESWYTDEEGLVLHPHLADPAKGYLNKELLEQSGSEFMKLWLQVGKQAWKEYLEAFLELNVGSWYPDDLTHTTIYPDVSYNIKGFLQTQEYDMQDKGFITKSLIPKLTRTYEQICRYNRYLKYPILPIIFSTGIPVWIIFLSICLLGLRSNTSLSFAPAAGPICLFVSYLFGPCTLARYMMPLYSIAPILLLLALSQPAAGTDT